MGQRCGGHNGGIFDPHAMMHFVPFFESPQDRYRVLDIGFANKHNLEATLERRIFLDVFAVLIQGGRANRAQFATRQGRLQHVGSIDRTFGSACTDQCMQLVDEQDDFLLRVFDLFQNRFEAVLELPSVLRSGQNRTEIERNYALISQHFGNVAGNNPLRQPFNDRRFPHAGFAD